MNQLQMLYTIFISIIIIIIILYFNQHVYLLYLLLLFVYVLRMVQIYLPSCSGVLPYPLRTFTETPFYISKAIVILWPFQAAK